MMKTAITTNFELNLNTEFLLIPGGGLQYYKILQVSETPINTPDGIYFLCEVVKDED